MNYFKLLAQAVTRDDLISLPQQTLEAGPDGSVSKALRIVFGLAGAVSVLIISIAAFQYVVSQGDAQSIAKARNTIIYALLGLVVCVLAFGIVTFVANNI